VWVAYSRARTPSASPRSYARGVNAPRSFVHPSLAADLLGDLDPTPGPTPAVGPGADRFAPTRDQQRALAREYAGFLRADAAVALNRDLGREHVTASCFVFSRDLGHVLLSFHRKGQFWVQFGGHLEPQDVSVAAAALREAREESGLDGLQLLGTVPLDLDRHSLGDGFARCAVHWDVGYAALVAADAVPSVSDESEDVAWWPVAALPSPVPPGFAERMFGVLQALNVT
jgi:8-oxo-dGTP pyrophosphatase MutT (NUDIX family)